MKQDNRLLFNRIPAAEVICSRAYGPLEDIDLRDSGEMKLNMGDYVSPLEARGWASRGWLGKRVFMATVIRLVPEILDELVVRYRDDLVEHKDQILSTLAAAEEWAPDPLPVTSVERAWELSRAFPMPETPATNSRKNAECVVDWMFRWRLGDAKHMDLAKIAWHEAEWRVFKVCAAENVSRRDLGEAWAKLRFYDRLAEPEAPQQVRPQTLSDLPHEWGIAIPVWLPTLETRESYESRAQEAFDSFLREDRKHWTRAAQDGGVVRTGTKRNGALHFKWLARYQVLEESYDDIAASAYVAHKTVSEAIKRTAEAIDLPLRPAGRPGRKRNTA